MKNNLVALSIFCLAVSIVVGSWLISCSPSNKKDFKIAITSQNKIAQTTQNHLLTQSDLAEYLGSRIEEVGLLGPVS